MTNVNNPSVPQDYSWMYQNPQAMPQALPERSEPEFEKKEKNPNIWKPTCTEKSPEYAAVIRILPQGMEGARANLRPEVHVLTHYLKDRTGKMWREVKCREMLVGPDGKAAPCPICKSIWDRWNTIKSNQGDAAAKASGLTRLLPQEEIYSNVLFRQDENVPENAGTVKIWSATPHQWEIAEKPLPDEYKSPSRNRKRKDNAQQNDQTNGTQKVRIARQNTRKFFPSNPITGVDFTVIASWDSTKQVGDRQGMPTYDESFYAEQSTPIAMKQATMQDGSVQWVADEAGICQILDMCHDLNQFRGDIPDEQRAQAIANEFWAMYDGVNGAQNNVQANTYQGQMAMAQQNQQAFAPQNQQAFVPQNQIPNVPANAKITTGNAASFMAPQAPANPVFSGQSIPATPAAPANPAFAPQQAPIQQPSFGQAPMQQPAYGQPAPAQPAPAQPAYMPPAAPMQQAPANPAFAPQQQAFSGPAQGISDGEDDLPF